MCILIQYRKACYFLIIVVFLSILFLRLFRFTFGFKYVSLVLNLSPLKDIYSESAVREFNYFCQVSVARVCFRLKVHSIKMRNIENHRRWKSWLTFVSFLCFSYNIINHKFFFTVGNRCGRREDLLKQTNKQTQARKQVNKLVTDSDCLSTFHCDWHKLFDSL